MVFWHIDMSRILLQYLYLYFVFCFTVPGTQKKSVQSFRKVIEIAPQQAVQFCEIKELAGVCSDGCLHSNMLKRQDIGVCAVAEQSLDIKCLLINVLCLIRCNYIRCLRQL